MGLGLKMFNSGVILKADSNNCDGDVAQLVERRTGTPLRQVRFPGAARDFFLPESTFSADSLLLSVLPPCAIACFNICARV